MEFDHPWGLNYIKEFIYNNIKINQIIFTQRRPYRSLLKMYRERMGKNFVMPKTEDVLNKKIIPSYFVENINSKESITIIKKFSPDLVIQAAVGIIKEEVLQIPKIGILNCHPGLLPKYRGCTCVEWAIYNDDPVGCTCHFITEKIDWGDIIMMDTLKIKRGDSYNDVRKKSMDQCARVLANSVEKIIQNKYFPEQIILNENEKRYFKPIDSDKMIIVKEKLEEEKYAHYVD